MTHYGNINGIKSRLNIPESNTSYDTAMTEALEEASRVIDMYLAPYVGTEDVYNTISFSFKTLPLTIVPDIINDIAEDFGVVFFKRRDVPKGVGLTGSFGAYNETLEGYIAQGQKKLETFINTYFKRGKVSIVNSTYDTKVV